MHLLILNGLKYLIILIGQIERVGKGDNEPVKNLFNERMGEKNQVRRSIVFLFQSMIIF